MIRVLHILLELERLYISRIAESAVTRVSIGSGAIPGKKKGMLLRKRGKNRKKVAVNVAGPPS